MTWRTHQPQPTRAQKLAARSKRMGAMAATVQARPARAEMGGTTRQPAPKESAIKSEAYRRLVASLPCKHCGIAGFSQAAHPNTGKGAGLKTDDRECFPLCTVHPAGGQLVPGCHEKFDQGALFTKAVRRAVEPVWGADTRRAIKAAGAWPRNLPEMLHG